MIAVVIPPPPWPRGGGGREMERGGAVDLAHVDLAVATPAGAGPWAVPPSPARRYRRPTPRPGDGPNRTGCPLLFPLDGGPTLRERACGERTPDDNGWDIFLTGCAGRGPRFSASSTGRPGLTTPRASRFHQIWADGSEARYAADVGNAAPARFDPDSSPSKPCSRSRPRPAPTASTTRSGRTTRGRLFDRFGS